MPANWHVRFLGEDGLATGCPYPTSHGPPCRFSMARGMHLFAENAIRAAIRALCDSVVTAELTVEPVVFQRANAQGL